MTFFLRAEDDFDVEEEAVGDALSVEFSRDLSGVDFESALTVGDV